MPFSESQMLFANFRRILQETVAFSDVYVFFIQFLSVFVESNEPCETWVRMIYKYC